MELKCNGQDQRMEWPQEGSQTVEPDWCRRGRQGWADSPRLAHTWGALSLAGGPQWPATPGAQPWPLRGCQRKRGYLRLAHFPKTGACCRLCLQKKSQEQRPGFPEPQHWPRILRWQPEDGTVAYDAISWGWRRGLWRHEPRMAPWPMTPSALLSASSGSSRSANAAEKTAQAGPSVWDPATHLWNPDWSCGSWHQPGTALATAPIWGMN